MSYGQALAALVERLYHFFQEARLEGYLVGGGLRDLLLGEHLHDLDIVVRGDGPTAARQIADVLHGDFARLGQEKGVGRVILSTQSNPGEALSAPFILDIATLRSEGLRDDLLRRDFTINALALPLEYAQALLASLNNQSNLESLPFVDPTHGLHDLRSRTVRIVRPSVFQDDPLRLLRAIRFSQRYQFRIARSTSHQLRRDAQLLIQVAPERLRDELFHLLQMPTIVSAVQAMERYRLLPFIFPAFFSHQAKGPGKQRLKFPKSRWKTLSRMHAFLSFVHSANELSLSELTLTSNVEKLARLLRSIPVGERWYDKPIGPTPRYLLFSLAALLYDLVLVGRKSEEQAQGKTSESELYDPFQFSKERFTELSENLHKLALGHQVVSFMMTLLGNSTLPWSLEPPPGDASAPWKAARHFFDHFGERGVDLAIFSLISESALPPKKVYPRRPTQPEVILMLIERYYRSRETLLPGLLIDGYELMARLGISHGPIVGTLLHQIRQAQLDGTIQTAEEAMRLADSLLKRNQRSPDSG
ncbi:MAG TPA: hypothetical protein VH540_00220 [Ktedonobacterales bacterium]|jgi:tRNA nucleotidyltransferase/poly(A) polymerase